MLNYDLGLDIIAFSTERHAVDPQRPYDGFNITHYTDDNPAHVVTCRAQLCESLGINDDHLLLPRQVHGTCVAEITEDLLQAYAQSSSSHLDKVENHPASSTLSLSAPLLEGVDALITCLPRTCIGVSTADCVPILLYDKNTSAIAAAHAGWRGTVARIASLTIESMHKNYGTLPANIHAVIGPSIGPDAFEVGDEVYEAFAAAHFPMSEIAFQAPVMNSSSQQYSSSLRWHIDLWRANAHDLVTAGVPAANIHISALCTYTHYDRFFSARRLGIHSGRMFTGIMHK